jgi:type I restriction modification system M subunit (site-specific DNA-methyltransferase subunit)
LEENMEQETKSIIDRIWTNFWEGGVTNPLTVIEQITYLLFIKGLDDIDIAHEKSDHMLGIKTKRIFDEKHQECRWSIFKNYPAEKMYKIVGEDVFPFIKSLSNNKNSGYAKYMEDAIFIIPTPIMLQRVVTAIDKLKMKDRDTKGDVYEYLLSKLSTAGTNGQFRTPRHIIKMMVELMKPTPEDIIVDPAAGSAGFLVEAGEYLRNNRNDLFLTDNLKEHFNNTMFYGFDMDRTMLRIGAMNLMQHGIENPNISYKDSLSEDNEDNSKYTLVLANPPFKGSIDSERTSKDLLNVTKTKKTELLFLALFLRILRTGGRAASIVPDGVLFGSSNAHKAIRKEIIEKHKLEAIISMPSGVFKPYAGVSTAIMIFTKTSDGGTDKVWFYDMTADGFSLDDQRQTVKENDIPDIIKRFDNRNSKEEQERARTEKSFFVPKEEIVENDYDLSINKYKEIVVEKKEYEEPKVILKRVIDMENELQQKLKELEELL